MKAVWQWLMGVLLLGSVPCLMAQPIHSTEPNVLNLVPERSGEATTVVPMQYREVPDTLYFSVLTAVTRHEPFDREPALIRGQVVRGKLQGTDVAQAISFLWEQDSGRLHLDLNRNDDLTDDPTGVFSSGERHSYQQFKDISLPAVVGDRRTVLTDLNLHSFRYTSHCSAGVRSYWSGQIQLQGKEWEIGRVELPLQLEAHRAHLFLRPWEERTERFATSTGAAGLLPWPNRLFLNGHAWQITHTDREVEGVRQMELQLTAETPQLGELQIEGESIEQLTFLPASGPVLLRQPGAVVQMPVGRYPQPRVLLAAQGVQANRQERPVDREAVVILQDSVAKLTVGGPLTNSVRALQRGRSLVLHYQLLGAGGDVYQLPNQDWSQPPRFTVYRGDKEIASGAFEYG
jgi:hypothetical protein